jgi:hypothetical protein
MRILLALLVGLLEGRFDCDRSKGSFYTSWPPGICQAFARRLPGFGLQRGCNNDRARAE